MAVIEAGAPVNGHAGDKETLLITVASSGDADVARVLIEAGADIVRFPRPTPAERPAARRWATPRCSG